MVYSTTLGLLMAASAVTSAWADTKFEPSVTVGTVYVDNFDLVPPGVPKTGEWIGELIPRLQMQEQAPNLTGVLDYSAEGLLFSNRSDINRLGIGKPCSGFSVRCLRD